MSAEMLPGMWPDRSKSDLGPSLDRTIEQLRAENRLTAVHDALIALAYRLADALERASGRGASVALLSAQYKDVLKELQSVPAPVEADLEDYDVVLLAVPDDAS